jgi:hypothetical membrane protein
MLISQKKLSGLLLFIGSTIGFIGIIIAETQYPNYSTANNFISDLGVGTSARIFNTALIIGGLLGVAGSFFLYRALGKRGLPVLVGLSALGSFIVGVFPESTGIPHLIGALLVFVAGGLSSIMAYRHTISPFRQVSLLLGVFTLGAFGLLFTGNNLGLGGGGMERMVTYPNIMWSFGFSGYLMANQTS